MNSTTVKTARSLWPHAIILWFVIFASAMAAWITFAVRQNMDLVQVDYYEEEIRFQQQLDRLSRTAALPNTADIHNDIAKGEVTVRLPEEHGPHHPTGRIHFYRPSDAALDFKIPLAVDSAGIQRIDVSALRPGHWKVRVQWTAEAQGYFYEQALVIENGHATESSGGRPGIQRLTGLVVEPSPGSTAATSKE